MTPQEIQTAGIVIGLVFTGCGFVLNAYSTLKGIKSRKLSNYQELTKSHRDLWKLTLDKPELYSRILDASANISKASITSQERRFVHLLLLHMTAAYYFSKQSEIVEIEKLKFDIDEFLSLPIPRAVWLESQKYFNRDFVSFVEKKPTLLSLSAIKGVFSARRPTLLRQSKRWKVLVLSDMPERLVSALSRFPDEFVFISTRSGDVAPAMIKELGIDFVVCFGYGRKVPPSVLRLVDGINVHGGLLPANRGPNPNLWAWIRGIPPGVTIHYLTKDFDAGDIIAEREITVPQPVSLQSSYDTVTRECMKIFEETWPLIRAGKCARKRQEGIVGTHKLSDQEPFSDLFSDEGLNMPIEDFVKIAKERIAQSDAIPQ